MSSCAPWFAWVWREQVDQSQHGRVGHAPFFCAAESHSDEESKGPGERARPRVPSGAPRARHVENATGLRPHFFQLSPRGRVLVHPRAGALPGTRALPAFDSPIVPPR